MDPINYLITVIANEAYLSPIFVSTVVKKAVTLYMHGNTLGIKTLLKNELPYIPNLYQIIKDSKIEEYLDFTNFQPVSSAI